jgi:hypothetical protein
MESPSPVPSVAVRLKLHDVSDVGYLLRDCSTAKRPVRRRLKALLALARLNPCMWRISSGGNHAEAIAIAKIKRAELSLANACRVREHGIKNRLEFRWRA